ncbi:MAG: hypothetical protein WEC39_00590 [Patescibacteria group bacterium]
MFLLIFLAAIPISILRGWVLTKLWAWFIMPVFGLPSLGIAPAIGFALIVGFFSSVDSEEDPTVEKFAELLLKGVITTFYFLVFGWLVSLFM